MPNLYLTIFGVIFLIFIGYRSGIFSSAEEGMDEQDGSGGDSGEETGPPPDGLAVRATQLLRSIMSKLGLMNDPQS